MPMRIIESFHAELIASAEQSSPAGIPDGKGEIAEKMIDTMIAPHVVGMQDELRVGSASELLATVRGKCRPEILAGIDASVGHNPDLSIHATRLVLSRPFLIG